MKIALVHDDLIQHGGAERLFEAMMETFPQADVFVSMVSDQWKAQISNSLFLRKFKSQNHNSKLKTSFMQKLPLKEKFYRHYFLLYPLAFESFDFTNYDVVLSSSTRFAHGVITRPETLHIAYFNTPPRMFWEPFTYFEESQSLRLLLTPFISWLRVWDWAAAQRPDILIANSKTPQARIKKYYGRDSHIIYPFVDLERFQVEPSGPHPQRHATAEHPSLRKSSPSLYVPANANRSNPRNRSPFASTNVSSGAGLRVGYFLVVSRLTAWKKIDIAIEACNQLKLPLKIIGEGPDFERLKRLAGPTVELLGRLTDEEVVSYYKNCRALLFPQKEDFGITPLEAQASGKPVVAFRAGGALETVIEGKTGEFFSPQTAGALAKVLKDFDTSRYQDEDCRRQAEKFSKQRFQRELKEFVENAYEKDQVRFL